MYYSELKVARKSAPADLAASPRMRPERDVKCADAGRVQDERTKQRNAYSGEIERAGGIRRLP